MQAGRRSPLKRPLHGGPARLRCPCEVDTHSGCHPLSPGIGHGCLLSTVPWDRTRLPAVRIALSPALLSTDWCAHLCVPSTSSTSTFSALH